MPGVTVTIYHNPRCTKSRQTLALLRERNVKPQVVEYLTNPPDAKTLAGVVKKLRMRPQELIRKKEFKELGVPLPEDDGEAIELMVAHPQIIERPIVVSGRKAVLGRPPENVLDILPE